MNAKKELLSDINIKKIRCASISCGKNIILKENYTEDELNHFLNELDFDYDNGYGGQELIGTVWLENGAWLERGEYDGSEWWEGKVYPDIPEECLSNKEEDKKFTPNTMNNQYIDIIIELNEEMFERFGNEFIGEFNYSTNGYIDIISFDNTVLWNSSEDSREFIEKINDYEPLKPFIKRKFNECINEKNKYKFIL